MSDHIVTFSVLPLAPERTLLRTKWLVHKDAVEGVDYDLNNLTQVWLKTNKQDGDLVAMAQRGVRQPAYQPGPYSPYTEELVEKFCDWYIGRMAAHMLPGREPGGAAEQGGRMPTSALPDWDPQADDVLVCRQVAARDARRPRPSSSPAANPACSASCRANS